mmetsp:Transcript_31623/g.65305  ORF Transcript_31623/g.65305 Transcript_31623/m.65305 type:complete len:90 (+) Transcript_31623:365-634(+)
MSSFVSSHIFPLSGFRALALKDPRFSCWSQRPPHISVWNTYRIGLVVVHKYQATKCTACRGLTLCISCISSSCSLKLAHGSDFGSNVTY